MRSRTRCVYGSNSPKNKTRSRAPRHRPLYHLDSLSKSKVSDYKLVEMFQTFSNMEINNDDHIDNEQEQSSPKELPYDDMDTD